ncbi:hypothetical protein [Candidatus Uabimicrobium sp. HlEnr_7]|uniref:SPW repeat domain-containing protein n=1 Tax=Candidatus Uabimicrobium helgolandensis TaxID=3095367 RepID=UPI0035577D5E
MSIRFITKEIHAVLDYPVAVVLMGAPFLFKLGGSHDLALWLSVCTGVAALILTIFTDHFLGVFRVLPYKFHLAVDFIVGVVFVVAPFLLGFSGVDSLFYWIIGATVLCVVNLHKPE